MARARSRNEYQPRKRLLPHHQRFQAMKPVVRVLILLAAVALLVGCTARQRPTRAPLESGSPTASAAAAASPGGPGQRSSTDDVLPALTAKADLKPVPQGEVNVAYAPNVP